MKKIISASMVVSIALMLGACTATEVDTTAGAAAGAGLGYVATGGNPWGTAVGAGAGGLIGNQIGQSEDMRNYYHSPYH